MYVVALLAWIQLALQSSHLSQASEYLETLKRIDPKRKGFYELLEKDLNSPSSSHRIISL